MQINNLWICWRNMVKRQTVGNAKPKARVTMTLHRRPVTD